RAGNVAQGINQRQHHQTEGQRNANVGDGAVLTSLITIAPVPAKTRANVPKNSATNFFIATLQESGAIPMNPACMLVEKFGSRRPRNAARRNGHNGTIYSGCSSGVQPSLRGNRGA